MPVRGRPRYQPTEKDRRIVEMMAGFSIPTDNIAAVIGVDPKTLRKHFRAELDIGFAKLHAQLSQNLLRIASGSDRQALIATMFALKARFGWVETTHDAGQRALGKKQEALLAAWEEPEDPVWRELMAPRGTLAKVKASS